MLKDIEGKTLFKIVILLQQGKWTCSLVYFVKLSLLV